MSYDKLTLNNFMSGLSKRTPGEVEFHQAVYEVADSVIPFIQENPKYQDANILERMTEPDRTIIFRVCWEDDQGQIRVNRGYRVQFNNSIGPYKGGLRFDPSVNLSILKFLGFEQTFKNSLTTLPMGSAKGGADFNPKGKSNREVMRFCQAFMMELSKHIGSHIDVPAGDIGVGAREISYMFGQYKRITNEFEGVLTGKGLEYGGSLIRTEATGYGCAYFMEEMLKAHNKQTKGLSATISGSGNVALYCAKKVIQLGGKVLTLSDSGGFIHFKEGLSLEELEEVIHFKTVERKRLSEYIDAQEKERSDLAYHDGKKPWKIKADLAYPCATQNEIGQGEANQLISNQYTALAEGANMPLNIMAINLLHEAHILYAPGKASNAGGVAMSGLEMTQNSMRISWDATELENRLKDIMQNIHTQCCKYGKQADGSINYVHGANIGGFIKVANAMLAYGVC